MVLKSEEGRAQVTLSVVLGHLHLGAIPQQQQQYKGRNGPARRRRRERRAAARQEAEEASKREENAKTDATNETEEVIVVEQNVEITKEAATVTEEVIDEFCSNQEYFDTRSKDDEFEKETVILSAGTLTISGIFRMLAITWGRV